MNVKCMSENKVVKVLAAAVVVMMAAVLACSALAEPAWAVNPDKIVVGPNSNVKGTVKGNASKAIDGQELFYITKVKSNYTIESSSNVTLGIDDEGRDLLYLKTGKTAWSARIRYNEAGMKPDGTKIDVVILVDGTVTTAPTKDGVVRVFRVDGAHHRSHDNAYQSVQTATVRVYETGTTKEVPGKFVVFFQDIDIERSNEYSESIEVTSHYENHFWIHEAMSAEHHKNQAGERTNGKELNVVGTSSGVKVSASHDCKAYPDSSVAFIATSGLTYKWRGESCDTMIGISVEPTAYPSFTVSKSPQDQFLQMTDSASFTVDADLPHVVSANHAKSITFTDTLQAGLTPEGATMRVERLGDDGSWSDVSLNWLMTTEGRTLKAVAINTNEGFATGKHRFIISAPVDQDANWKALPEIAHEGKKYRKTTNMATVTTVSQEDSTQTRNTNVVNVYVNAIGKASIVKRSEEPAWVDELAAYSLEGAVYDIFGPDSSALAATVVTRADGTTPVQSLQPGSYTVVERQASPGHKLGDQKTFSILAGDVVTIESVEPVIYLDMDTVARKVDRDRFMPTGSGVLSVDGPDVPEGNGRFAGMKVKVDFFHDANWNAPQRASAVFAGDGDGVVAFAKAAPVDGTSWRYRKDNRNVMPLGSFQVTETAAPTGYKVDGEVHRAQVVQNGYEAVLVPGDKWYSSL